MAANPQNPSVLMGVDSARGSLTFAIAVLVTGLLLLFWATLPNLHLSWTTGFTYTHGYLVVLAAIWVGVQKLRSGSAVQIGPFWLALPVFIAAGFVLILAQAVAVDAIQFALIPALLWLALLCCFGWPLALRLMPAAALLYAAVPVWDILTTPLRMLTTTVVGYLLSWHSFPVVLDGYRVSVPAGEFEIAGGCSGLHFFIVGATVGFIFSVLDAATLRQKLQVMAIALGLSLLANWIRVYSLILVGQFTQMQHYLITTDHYYFGWAIFAVALVSMLLLFRRVVVASSVRSRHSTVEFQGSVVAPAFAVALSAIVLSGSAAFVLGGQGRIDADVQLVPPIGWRVDTSRLTSWRPKQSAEAATLEGHTATPDNDYLDFFTAFYAQQRDGHELAAWGHRPWNDLWTFSSAIDYAGFDIAIVVDSLGRHRLVAWQQIVADVPVNTRVDAKREEVLGLFRGDHSAWFRSVSARCRHDCRSERDRFVKNAETWFQATTYVTRLGQ